MEPFSSGYKMGMKFVLIAALSFLSCTCLAAPSNKMHTPSQVEEEARKLIDELAIKFKHENGKVVTAEWNYVTNITEENSIAKDEATLQFQRLKKEATFNLSMYDWSTFEDEDLKRQMKYYHIIGNRMDDEDLQEMNQLGTFMSSAYSTAKICEFGQDLETCEPSLELEPDLVSIMAKSRDAGELLHAWVEWRKATGKTYREEYLEMVDLQTKGAHSLGLDNLYQQWVVKYEVEDMKGFVEQVWTQPEVINGEEISLEMLYKQLHAYVREKLRNFYSEQNVDIPRYGRIPAHLLGNMWAQQWTAIEEIVTPFDDVPLIDVTDAMVDQGYDAKSIFELAESFFRTMGLRPMTKTFWEKSMLTKPSDRDVVCHASAEDFLSENDFRIKMCTEVNHADLVTAHHEMGHIVYFMEYENLTYIYRDSANPGFHEALGDTMSLAVGTTSHLQQIGLLPASDNAPSHQGHDHVTLSNGQSISKLDLNFLMHMALEKIAFLPYSLALDEWRWLLFTEEIDDTNMNQQWWELRKRFQGLMPPTERSEEDFDPGAKYHVPTSVPYIRYFVSFVVQFQFYEALCIKAGQYQEDDPNTPLYGCDFSLGGEEAGSLLRAMMQQGFSKPWTNAMEDITEGASATVSGKSMTTYFLPLYYFLREENSKTGTCVGWGADCEEKARTWLDEEFNKKLDELSAFASQKAWEYQTNVNDETAAASDEASISAAKYVKDSWMNEITQYEYERFTDERLKRQFGLLQSLGVEALTEKDYAEYVKEVSRMTTIYGTGKICPYSNRDCDLDSQGMTLEPGIESIINNPSGHSFEELTYVWQQWRNAVGRPLRSHFKELVAYNNLAAVENGFKDASEMWVDNFLREDPEFEQDLSKTLQEIQPLYSKLHGYVRHHLRQHWGEKAMGKRDPIPAHLLGNMWGQTWENVFSLVSPYPNVTNPIDDVNAALIDQGYDVRRIFELSNSFYKGIGLGDMEMCYDTNCGLEDTPENKACFKHQPLIEKPEWDVVCHASAWDMSNMSDYRIKMCTEVDLSSLVTVHHEMGHIQYYIQYRNQPNTFRAGANEGFHEAIGDTMALAVQTSAHLSSIGLLDSDQASYESDLNYLMKSALERLAFLPYGYVMDSFRWNIFRGSIGTDQMNYGFWKLREQHQGLAPPVARNEEDFDAGAKYHVATDTSYIRYYVAHLLQFKLYRQMCLDSRQYQPQDPYSPLHRCDFSAGEYATEAGKKMRDLLQSGASMPWPDTLEAMTGDRKIDAGAILEYFAPLEEWLDEYIAENDVETGWDSVIDTYFPENAA